MMRGNGACDPAVLDRIERGMDKIGPGGGFKSSPASFRGTLRQTLMPLDGLSKSSSDVLGGNPGAGAEFRRWLSLIPDGKSGFEPSDMGKHGRGAPFKTGRDFVRILIAAALLGRDERDLAGMRGAVGGLIDTTRWVESLDLAAMRLEQTGDPGLLEHLIYLFEHHREGVGRGEVMPPPPGDLVTDPGECMRLLNDALDDSRRRNPKAWGTIRTTTDDLASRGGWMIAERSSPRPPTENITRVEKVTTRLTRPHTDRHGRRIPGRRVPLKSPYIVIEGHDFGASQPTNVSVQLPCESSCRGATVRTWSDERITVRLPTWLGTGCVGFRYESTHHAEVIDAVSDTLRGIREVAAMCESSFGGPVEPVHPVTVKHGDECPICLDNGRNFVAREKAPEIELFTGPDGEIDSLGQATLSWLAWGAPTLTVTSDGPGPAFGAAPERPSGSRTLRFSLFVPRGAAETRYTLTATNQWGTREKTITVKSRMSNRNVKLMDLQDRILARFGGASVDAVHDLHLSVANRDYMGSHYNFDTGKNVCFAFLGIGYGDPHVLGEDANAPLDLDNPELLLFDDQNMLIGFAYVRCHHDNTPADFAHPDLPLETWEWYTHPAGWHMKDGGFSADPQLESLPNPCRPPGPFDVWPPAGALYPHGPVWGIHIFFNLNADRSPAGPPLVGVSSHATDLPSPPNIPHFLAPRVVDVNFCADGGFNAPGWFVPSSPP